MTRIRLSSYRNTEPQIDLQNIGQKKKKRAPIFELENRDFSPGFTASYLGDSILGTQGLTGLIPLERGWGKAQGLPRPAHGFAWGTQERDGVKVLRKS